MFPLVTPLKPPTLDPGRMVPPSLVPDAEKMRQDGVDVFSEKIRWVHCTLLNLVVESDQSCIRTVMSRSIDWLVSGTQEGPNVGVAASFFSFRQSIRTPATAVSHSPSITPTLSQRTHACASNNFESGGDFDHGEPILLPEGKTMSSKQLQEITTVISQRQAEVVILLEEETLR